MHDIRSKFKPPRGTKDLFETELLQREGMESLLFEIARSYGYQRIETPVFEHFEVFDSTSRLNRDKCYNFKDKSGRELVLRSDINAPISRAVVNNISSLPMPVKLFFSGKVYRYRHYIAREFTMAGLENYGMPGTEAEVEILQIMDEFLRKLGLDNCRIEYNNLRIYSEYMKEVIRRYSLDVDLENALYRLSLSHSEQETIEILGLLPQEEAKIVYELLNCTGRLSETIISLKSLLVESSVLREQFQKVVDFDRNLDSHGLVNRKLDLTNLHGMGFYTGLTYRIHSDVIGKNIADGGRLDTFTANLGGKELPATGLGISLTRIANLASSHGSLQDKKQNGVLVVADQEIPVLDLDILLKTFRRAGWITEHETVKRKFRQRLKYVELKGYRGVLYLTHQKQSDVFRFEFFNDKGISVSLHEGNNLRNFEGLLNNPPI